MVIFFFLLNFHMVIYRSGYSYNFFFFSSISQSNNCMHAYDFFLMWKSLERGSGKKKNWMLTKAHQISLPVLNIILPRYIQTYV